MAGYGSDNGFAEWLVENGYAVPDGSQSLAVLRHRGSAYLDNTYGSRFSGLPVDPEQDRAWPRAGATIFGAVLGADVIPKRVEYASYHAAFIAATNPSALTATVDPNARVKRSKVEGIEEEYFEPGSDGVLASLSSDIEGLLAPLLQSTASFPAILVV